MTSRSNPRNKYPEVTEQIGSNLLHLRTRARLSRAELGAWLGITFQQIEKYENGTNRISAPVLHEMKKILGCNYEDFFAHLDGNQPTANSTIPQQEKLLNRLCDAFFSVQNPKLQMQLIRLVEELCGS